MKQKKKPHHEDRASSQDTQTVGGRLKDHGNTENARRPETRHEALKI